MPEPRGTSAGPSITLLSTTYLHLLIAAEAARSAAHTMLQW